MSRARQVGASSLREMMLDRESRARPSRSQRLVRNKPMPSHAAFSVVLAALCGFSAGCADPTQRVTQPATNQPATNQPATNQPTTPPVALAWPPLTRQATVYRASDALYRIGGLSAGSRFALYDDGTFALQFHGVQTTPMEYRGRYTRTESVVEFDWDGWSIAGPWGATGTLRGDTLNAKYNIIMILSDFVDGEYVRVPEGV
jgi:hypothetical protein